MTMDYRQRLLELILAADRQAANELIDQWTTEHGPEQALTELLEPAVRLLGEKWSGQDNVSLAQGYMAGKIVEDLMAKTAAIEADEPARGELKGPAVMGNIQDDYHGLGRKLVVIFLRAAGWKVYDLGNDIAPCDFVDKALETGAKVVGASAMMYTNAMNIKGLREEIDNRGLAGRLQLAVGGAVFALRPELVAEVGGDGTATNAIAACDLMDDLHNKAVAEGGGQ